MTPRLSAVADGAAAPEQNGEPARTLPLAHHPTAPAAARRATRNVLNGWGLPEDDTQDALTVVSELVTNAVEHALPPVTLHLTHIVTDETRCVLIDVIDGGGSPASGAWSSSRAFGERGRGQTVVSALAARTGIRRIGAAVSRWALLACS